MNAKQLAAAERKLKLAREQLEAKSCMYPMNIVYVAVLIII